MKRAELERYFKNGWVLVSEKTYAIVKCRKAFPDAFAVIRDDKEVTCVIEESEFADQNIQGIERDWRLITFDMILPFGLVGFIAQVSGALAKEGISILTFSAYSTDHIFVKNKDLDKTIETLRKLGFLIRIPVRPGQA
jgi:hypothetical protein